MRRREINLFSLSFLDAMTCGFGAVVLFYMVINASAGLRSGEMTADLRGEASRLEDEVLDGYNELVEVRNGEGAYEAPARWADPDLDQAAVFLRRALDDPAWRQGLADRATARVASSPSRAQIGASLADVL